MKAKGYLLAILAVFLSALAPVFTAIVVEDMEPLVASFYWFLSASFWSLFLLLPSRAYADAIPAFKANKKNLSMFGAFAALSVILFFYSIEAIGPAVTSFLNNIAVIVMVFLSVIFLNERFETAEMVGAVVAIAGVCMITFSPIEYLGGKAVCIVGASFAYAFSQFYAKSSSHMDPILLNLYRSISTLLGVSAFLLISGASLLVPDGETLLILAIVPLFSAVLQHLCIFTAYKHADLGRLQLIKSATPFVVLLYYFLLSGDIPLPHQLAGGIVISAGILLMLTYRRFKNIAS